MGFERYLAELPNGIRKEDIRVPVAPDWFARTQPDSKAGGITIPEDAEFQARVDTQGTGQQRTFNVGGRFVFLPDLDGGGFSVTGTLTTSAGDVSKVAEVDDVRYVHTDSTGSELAGWAACATHGEVLLPLTALSMDPPVGRYLESSYTASLLDDSWILVSLDKDDGHEVCYETLRGLGANVAVNYPGTMLHTARGRFVRRSDGWQYLGVKQ